MTIASVYVFAGDVDKPVQQEKYAFLEAMTGWFTDARARAASGAGHSLVCGDFNVAHTAADGDVYIDNVRRVASLLDSLPHAESAIFGAGSYS